MSDLRGNRVSRQVRGRGDAVALPACGQRTWKSSSGLMQSCWNWPCRKSATATASTLMAASPAALSSFSFLQRTQLPIQLPGVHAAPCSTFSCPFSFLQADC